MRLDSPQRGKERFLLGVDVRAKKQRDEEVSAEEEEKKGHVFSSNSVVVEPPLGFGFFYEPLFLLLFWYRTVCTQFNSGFAYGMHIVRSEWACLCLCCVLYVCLASFWSQLSGC